MHFHISSNTEPLNARGATASNMYQTKFIYDSLECLCFDLILINKWKQWYTVRSFYGNGMDPMDPIGWTYFKSEAHLYKFFVCPSELVILVFRLLESYHWFKLCNFFSFHYYVSINFVWNKFLKRDICLNLYILSSDILYKKKSV